MLKECSLETFVESRFGLDGGAMFGVVPKPLWERTNPADDKNRIRMAARCLLLDVGEHRVLVDVGMGDVWSDKERSIYRVEHPNGSLSAQLRAAGVDPESITDVILTHLHFDHAGGLVERDGEEALRPTFPSATHWVQRENWVWAHHPTQRDAGSYRRETFAPLGAPDGPELELLDGPTTLFDAIELRVSRGHTPGMQYARFRSRDRWFCFAADVIPTAGHLRIPYVMGYDCFPLVTMQEKEEILSWCAERDAFLGFEHDPDVAFATVDRDGAGRYRVAESVASADLLG